MPILGKLVPVDTQTMERSMHIPQERPWPTIDLAELRFGIAFGSSVEELADLLQRRGRRQTKMGSRSSTICDEGLRRPMTHPRRKLPGVLAHLVNPMTGRVIGSQAS